MVACDKRRISLNMVECSGCGACIESCPEGFGWNETRDKAMVVKDCVPADQAREAVKYCPCDCIEMEGECRE